MKMLWYQILIFSLVGGVSMVSAQQVSPKRIYLAPDDHTDYFWTATGDQYRQAFLEMIDYYLDRADATMANPADHQSRWNCDGSLWMWEYEKNRSPHNFQRFIDRIKSGHISVPLTALVSCYGGAPVEAILRGMYYPGSIERRYDLRFHLAVSMENQTLPYGLGSLWAGAGARYSWKGICGCATKVPDAGSREHEIYWWNGPDGSRILTKWYSLVSNQSIGGYAEGRSPSNAIDYVDSDPSFLARHPYGIIGIFGQGWDDFKTTNQNLLNAAITQSNASRRIIVSNEADFFQDFESVYGQSLPSLSCAYGNEWDLYCASMAEVSARIKRSVEKLRAAEALATLVSLADSTFMDSRKASRDRAFLNYGLYWEHDWTADGPVGRQARADWQRAITGQIEDYVDSLFEDSQAALGGMIHKSGTSPRFYVFNPLGWSRTDSVDLPYTTSSPFHVVDLSNGLETPSQKVTLPGGASIRILARSVPPVGYRVFEIRSGAGTAFSQAATVNGNTLENDMYRLTIDPRGSVTSWIDKTRTNREFVRTVDGLAVNDFGSGAGTTAIENAGPVSVTLKTTIASPLPRTVRATLTREVNRVDFMNEIQQNFSDVRTWGFGFNLDNPVVNHEEVGAVIRAKLLADGGHYSGRNARYDWLTLNHFADIGSGSLGVTLSNADCYYMRLGNSTPSILDTSTPLIRVLAGGQVDGTGLGIQDQDGDTHFLQRFALQTHGAYSSVDAMKFALEHQNPLIAGPVTGGQTYPETTWSFLTVSDNRTLLWALKPAEEGINRGIVARLWNLSDQQATSKVTLQNRNLRSAKALTHIETETGNAILDGGALKESFQGHQIRTFLLDPEPGSASNSSWMLY